MISPKPGLRAADDSSRRSLQIFDSLMALRLSDAENDMNAPVSLVDSTRSVGRLEVEPGDLAQVPQRPRPRSRGAAVMPVPIAVAPMLISYEQVRVLGEPAVVLAEGRGEAVELLAEGHRHGILQLRAPDLQHVVELDGLARNARRSRSSSSSRRQQVEAQADLDRGRVDVVGRLAAVGVVDRATGTRSRPSRGRRARARCW